MIEWNTFAKVNRADWMAKASADLKGKIDVHSLKYIVDEHISIDPFLTKDEVNTSLSIPFPSPAIGVEVMYTHDAEGNQKIKKMLTLGAEAIKIKVSEHTDFEVLLEGIYLEMITLILSVQDHFDHTQKKINTYISNYYPNQRLEVYTINASEYFVFMDAEASVSERIKHLKHVLNQCLKTLDKTIFVVVELKADFLAQIAELKVFRKIISDYGFPTQNIKIYSKIKEKNNSVVDINPLIVSSYDILSAYLGCSDIVFSLPFDKDEESTRLSLNVQHILVQESNINVVHDALSGSYIVEKMIEEMQKIGD